MVRKRSQKSDYAHVGVVAVEGIAEHSYAMVLRGYATS